MKLIFISDIHANYTYLSQLIGKIELENADQIYFLGDAIGYYDDPKGVLDWLRSVNAICLKGNHEHYFLNELKYSTELNDIYRIEHSRENISDENYQYLKSWPNKIDCVIQGKRFLMVHGDINSSENHIYKCEDLDRNLIKDYDYYIYGHTHIPLISFHYGCCVINPGSVGQPRDYTATPSFAVLNLETSEVSIRKIKVNADEYCKSLEAQSMNQKVIDILKRKLNGKD